MLIKSKKFSEGQLCGDGISSFTVSLNEVLKIVQLPVILDSMVVMWYQCIGAIEIYVWAVTKIYEILISDNKVKQWLRFL